MPTSRQSVSNGRRHTRRRLAVETLDRRLLLAGDLELLRDIADNSTVASSNPTKFIEVGTKLFFTAVTPMHGEELWSTDGTEAGTQMVRDLFPGSLNSGPRNMVNMNGVLFFTANDGSNGEELWRSDGTAAGTMLVKDINPGTSSSLPNNLTVFNGSLVFVANDGTRGQEIWRSDGTNAGTTIVSDIQAGVLGSNPSSLAVVGNKFFFNASTSATGAELWSSDGTAPGTQMVADILAGTAGSFPSALTNIGGVLYFNANNGTSGVEPWTSDGTTLGTQMLADLEPGSGSSRPNVFIDFGGQAIFPAMRTSDGTELWISNGTAGGTTQLRDINPGASSSIPTNFRRVGSLLYFTALQDTTGSELWSTDGTTTGTNLVKDIVPGPNSSAPSNLVNWNGTLHFSSATSSTLWKSDGTNTGTVQLPIPSPIRNFTPSGGVLYFVGSDAAGDTELWRSDSTAAGTYLIKNINNENASSTPTLFTEVNGKLFFTAISSLGNELWMSDGTPAGTVIVKDITPGPLGSGISSLVNFNGMLYFVSSGALWRSDGTDSGTFPIVGQVGNSISGVFNPVVVGDKLFFTASRSDGTTGVELFKSDGTAAGTELVRDIQPGNGSSSPFFMVNMNGVAYFSANNGSSGRELWRSDGTAAGTVLVRDMSPGGSGSYPQSMTNVDGILYMTASLPSSGIELWRSNGTQAGTFLVKDIFPGAAGSSISSMRNINGKLMFNANNGIDGGELWVSDGTSGGTFMVKDIAPGNQSNVAIAGSIGNFALFFANDGLTGTELWKSDGTLAGTTLVKDIFSGPGTSFTGSFAAQSLAGVSSLGNQLYFAANDGINGQEIWRTDGTTNNTVLLDDITGDSGGARPSAIAMIAGRLFVAAGRGDVGVELFSRAPMSPPTLIGLSNTNLLETATAGATIGTLSSTDSDVGDTWSYSLVGGAGSTDNGNFTITGDQLVLATVPPNLGSQASYSIRIRSVDSEGNFLDQPFVIHVSSVAPVINVTGPNNITNPVSGQEVQYTATIQDPGNGAGPYSVRIDWDGDGSWDELATGNSPLQLAHAYAASGSYVPKFQAVDPEGITDSTIADSGVLSVAKWAVQGSTFAIGGSDGGAEDDLIVVEPATVAGQFLVTVNWVNLQTAPATTFSLAGLGVSQLQAYSGNGNDRLVLRGNSLANIMAGDGDSRTLSLDLAADLIAIGDPSVEQLSLEGMNGNDSFTLRGNVNASGGIGNDTFLIQDGSVSSLSTSVNGDSGSDTLSYALWSSSVELTLNSSTLGNGSATGNVLFSGVESYRGSNQIDTLRGPSVTATWIVNGPQSGTLNGRPFLGFENLVGSSAIDNFRLTTSSARIGNLDGVSGNDTVSVLVPGQNTAWELNALDGGIMRNASTSDVLGNIQNVKNWTGSNTQIDTLQVLATGSLSGRFTAGTGSPVDHLDLSLIPSAIVNLQTATASNLTSISGFDSYHGDGSTATLIGRNAVGTWTITGANTGTLVQTATSIFTGFSNLTGGSLDDTFIFDEGGSLSGTLNAGNGLNALSYASRSTPVTVDFSLSTPTATNVGTIVDSFTIVMGGSGNDTLVASNLRATVLIGNAGNDSLTGGSQRDILFAGTGADTLQGGGGDDILFGAATAHDADLVGLKRIRQEWISSHTYLNRIAYLQGTTSGGLNGTYLLTNAAPDRLLDDGEVDVLLGQLGRDWFLWDTTDAALSDLAGDEVVSPS